jgi:hypothetical protein
MFSRSKLSIIQTKFPCHWPQFFLHKFYTEATQMIWFRDTKIKKIVKKGGKKKIFANGIACWTILMCLFSTRQYLQFFDGVTFFPHDIDGAYFKRNVSVLVIFNVYLFMLFTYRIKLLSHDGKSFTRWDFYFCLSIFTSQKKRILFKGWKKVEWATTKSSHNFHKFLQQLYTRTICQVFNFFVAPNMVLEELPLFWLM